MTDERWTQLGPYFEREYLKPHELCEVKAELDRARAREARLEEALMHVFTRVALTPTTADKVRVALETE